MRSAELLEGTHKEDEETCGGYKEDFGGFWRILEDLISGRKQRPRAQEQPTGCGIANTPGSGSGVLLSDDSLDRSDQPIHSITPRVAVPLISLARVAVPLNSSFSDKFSDFVFCRV